MNDDAGQGASPLDRTLTCAAALLAVLWLGWVQMSFGGLYDLDSYFHARAAEQIAHQGVSPTFPQATKSTWLHAYSDKDFLFHALVIPFVADGELVAGGKWAVVLLDALVLAAFAYAIVRLDLRFGALWVLLLVATSPYYATRLVSLRPHVLGLALVTVEIVLVLRERWKTLFVVAGLHVVAHSSFVLLPALVVARAVACWITGERQPVKVALGVVAGMVVASLLHPYFPNNLSVAYDQLVEVARRVWFEDPAIPRAAFGSELGPLTWQAFLAQLPGWLPAAVGLVLVLTTRGVRGWPPRDVYLLLVAAGFLVLASRSRRFIDVMVVAALLLAAALWTRLAAGRSLSVLLRARSFATVPCVVGFALLLAFAVQRVGGLRDNFARQAMGDVYAPAVAALDQIAAPDDVVYHVSWMDFAVLYAFRPHGRYISGLDPIFLYKHDPALFQKNLRLQQGFGRGPLAAQTIARDFGARWIYVTTQPRDQAFRRMLQRSSGVELVYADGIAEIWRVIAVPPARGVSSG